MRRGIVMRGIIALACVSVLFLYLVQAMHFVQTFNGGTSFFVNEDVSFLYNFSINNSGATTYENITEINVTLPAGFSFVSGSQGLNVSTGVFSHTSSLLTWKSDAGSAIVQNSSKVYLWFRAIAADSGNFNFTVTTLNASGPFNTTLISIVVNDTTIPSSVAFVSPTGNAGTNSSASSLSVNVSVTDNGALQKMIVRLYNASHNEINSSIGTATSLFVNFTGLVQGTYRVNASANDTFGNINASETRAFILDTTAPSVTLGSAEVTSSSIGVNITLSDTLAGVNTLCSVSRSGAVVTWSGNSQRLYESGLACVSTYNYTVTCSDSAGNSKSQNVSATTLTCAPGQGQAGATASAWKATYAASDAQLATGHTQELALSEAIKVRINNEEHHVGIVSFSGQSATINVSSFPQQAVFLVGQTKQFEVTNDSFYDLNVSLRGVSATKVNVTVLSVHESLPLQKAGASAGQGLGATNVVSAFNASGNVSGNVTSTVRSSSIAYWGVLIVFISVIILIVVFLLVSYLRKSRRENEREW